MSITAQSKIIVGENALVQKVSDEMVILDSESGQYYTLNLMATEMLEHLKEGKSVEETALAICEEYDASKEEVLQDIEDMLDTLINKQLVSLA